MQNYYSRIIFPYRELKWAQFNSTSVCDETMSLERLGSSRKMNESTSDYESPDKSFSDPKLNQWTPAKQTEMTPLRCDRSFSDIYSRNSSNKFDFPKLRFGNLNMTSLSVATSDENKNDNSPVSQKLFR